MESIASKEYFESGIEQFDKAKYGDAIDFFLKGIEADPENGLCYLYAGVAYIYLRDTEKTKPFIEKALKCELPPSKGDNYLKAKKCMYNAVLMDKTNAEYYCYYADLFFPWWKQLTGADQMDFIEDVSFFIDNFNQLKMNGHQADCYYNRGLAYKALAYYERVDYETKKKSEEDFQNAINDFSKAISIDDSHDKYYLSRGLIYLDSEKNSEALSDFSKAIQLNDANPESYFLKARVCEEIGNIDEALKNYIYALHLDDTNAKYFFQLGRLYDFYLKDYEKAYQCYIKGKEFADDPFLLNVLNGSIEETIQLMNPEIKTEENNDNYEPEASLFGKIMNVVKSGLSEVSKEYNKKIEKIEQNKERFRNRSIDELREIIMNSNVFEEKVAARRLLEEQGY